GSYGGTCTMCNHCVIEGVRQSMLSRRTFFKRAAAAGAAAVAAGAVARPVLAQGASRVVDLTHAYDPTFPTSDGQPGIEYGRAVESAKGGHQLHKPTIYEATGPHLGAPFHFSADGTSVDQIDPQTLVAPLVIVDITQTAAEDANATVDAQDLERWISAN